MITYTLHGEAGITLQYNPTWDDGEKHAALGAGYTAEPIPFDPAGIMRWDLYTGGSHVVTVQTIYNQCTNTTQQQADNAAPAIAKAIDAAAAEFERGEENDGEPVWVRT